MCLVLKKMHDGSVCAWGVGGVHACVSACMHMWQCAIHNHTQAYIYMHRQI